MDPSRNRAGLADHEDGRALDQESGPGRATPPSRPTPASAISTEQSAPDQELLTAALARLKAHSRLEYRGEFGPEITTFIPFVAWLKQQGYLAGRRIVTYSGMRPYYFFLDDSEFEGKVQRRSWVPVAERDWPSNSTYTASASPWHIYPDYRLHFRPLGRQFHRPVLFIQNKFTVEWGEGPINYVPLNSLQRLLELTASKFDVVYSRPRESVRGYSYDDNASCDYPDRTVIRQFAHVLDFEEACQDQSGNYNQTKLEVLAKSHLFVAVQGGGAHLLACFGESLLLLLHCAGEEYPHAYRHGAYKYLAAQPPWLLVAQDTEQFRAGIEVIGSALVQESKLLLPTSATDVVKRLSL